MNNYIIRKILNEDDIQKINLIIPSLIWYDGLKSAINLNKKKKSNFESGNENINKIIMSSVDLDSCFHEYTVPKESSECLISKMKEGDYYYTHEDLFYLGQFSTTVFLTDKNNYDGGELCLLINDEELKIKLDHGYAITYPTGIAHRVNKVTRGERIVAVFWTKSLIDDDFMRKIYTNASKIRSVMDEKVDENDNLLDYKNDPYFLSNSICNSILRRYSKL